MADPVSRPTKLRTRESDVCTGVRIAEALPSSAG